MSEIRPEGSGEPLPGPVSAWLSEYFEADLSGVRVHEQAQSLGQVGARAAAFADHVMVRFPVSAQPSAEEMGVLGHEVAHVLQHQRGELSGSAFAGRGGVRSLELAADRHQARIQARYRRQDSVGNMEVDWHGFPDAARRRRLETALKAELERRLPELLPGKQHRIQRLVLDAVASPDQGDAQVVAALADQVCAQARRQVGGGSVPGEAAPVPAGAPILFESPQDQAKAQRLAQLIRDELDSFFNIDEDWIRKLLSGGSYRGESWTPEQVGLALVALRGMRLSSDGGINRSYLDYLFEQMADEGDDDWAQLFDHLMLVENIQDAFQLDFQTDYLGEAAQAKDAGRKADFLVKFERAARQVLLMLVTTVEQQATENLIAYTDRGPSRRLSGGQREVGWDESNDLIDHLRTMLRQQSVPERLRELEQQRKHVNEIEDLAGSRDPTISLAASTQGGIYMTQAGRDLVERLQTQWRQAQDESFRQAQREKLNQMESDYQSLVAMHPVLLMQGMDAEAVEALSGKSNFEIRRDLKKRLYEVLMHCRKSKELVLKGDVNVWMLDKVIPITMQATGVSAGSEAAGWIEEKVKSEHRWETAWNVVNVVLQIALGIVAIAASVVSGGTSLVAYAAIVAGTGLALYSAVEATHDYKVHAALGQATINRYQTILDAEGLGSELAWLWFDWVSVVAFGAGDLVGMFKAAKVARAVKAFSEGTKTISEVSRELRVSEKVLLEAAARSAQRIVSKGGELGPSLAFARLRALNFPKPEVLEDAHKILLARRSKDELAALAPMFERADKTAIARGLDYGEEFVQVALRHPDKDVRQVRAILESGLGPEATYGRELGLTSEAWRARMARLGVGGDYSGTLEKIRLAGPTGEPAAQAEMRAFEDFQGHGFRVEVINEATRQGAGKNPEAKLFRGGQEFRLEVKTPNVETEVPHDRGFNSLLTTAKKQLDEDIPGLIRIDLSDYDLHTPFAGDLGKKTQILGREGVEAQLRRRFGQLDPNQVRYLEVIWRDEDGTLMRSFSMRNADDAVVGPVTRRFSDGLPSITYGKLFQPARIEAEEAAARMQSVYERFVDEELTEAQMTQAWMQSLQDAGVPAHVTELLQGLDEYQLASVIRADPVTFIQLASSRDPQLIAYLRELMQARAAYKLGDEKLYRWALRNAKRLEELPLVKGGEQLNQGSGNYGLIFTGEFEGRQVVVKADRLVDYDTATETANVLEKLAPYGGPEMLGRVRVLDPENGIWREGIAMERIHGVDLLSLRNAARAGRELPLQVTPMHLEAVDRLERQLSEAGQIFKESNLGDYILTSDPRRPLVPVDLFVEPGTQRAAGLLDHEMKPIRETIEELIGKGGQETPPPVGKADIAHVEELAAPPVTPAPRPASLELPSGLHPGSLEANTIVSRETIGGSANKVYKVTLTDGSTHVVKGEGFAGKMTGHMFGISSQSKMEVAAYRFDQTLGLNMVPRTEMVEMDGKLFVKQEWRPGQTFRKLKKANSPVLASRTYESQVADMHAFDYLLQNIDRHADNFLIDPHTGRVVLIDNGLSGARWRPFYRTGAMPKAVSQRMVQALQELSPTQVREALEGAPEGFVQSTLRRRDALLKAVEDGKVQILDGAAPSGRPISKFVPKPRGGAPVVSMGEHQLGVTRGGVLQRASNARIDAVNAEYRAFFGRDVSYTELEQIFAPPAGSGLTVQLTSVTRSGPNQLKLMASLKNAQGQYVGRVERILTKESSGAFVLKNEMIKLDPGVAGAGYNKTLYAQQDEFLRSISTHPDTRTELHADLAAGPYVWATQGYEFTLGQMFTAQQARTNFQKAWKEFLAEHGVHLSDEELARFREPADFARFDDGRRLTHKIYICPHCGEPMIQNRRGFVRCNRWCNSSDPSNVYEEFWDPARRGLKPARTIQVHLGKEFMLTQGHWYGVRYVNREARVVASEGVDYASLAGPGYAQTVKQGGLNAQHVDALAFAGGKRYPVGAYLGEGGNTVVYGTRYHNHDAVLRLVNDPGDPAAVEAAQQFVEGARALELNGVPVIEVYDSGFRELAGRRVYDYVVTERIPSETMRTQKLGDYFAELQRMSPEAQAQARLTPKYAALMDFVRRTAGLKKIGDFSPDHVVFHGGKWKVYDLSAHHVPFVPGEGGGFNPRQTFWSRFYDVKAYQQGQAGANDMIDAGTVRDINAAVRETRAEGLPAWKQVVSTEERAGAADIRVTRTMVTLAGRSDGVFSEIPVGREVLIPRSGGKPPSRGLVVMHRDDGRVMVQFMVDGKSAWKTVDAQELAALNRIPVVPAPLPTVQEVYPVGTRIRVPRTDGSTSEGVVVGYAGGKVQVEFPTPEGLGSKGLSEELLNQVNPGRYPYRQGVTPPGFQRVEGGQELVQDLFVPSNALGPAVQIDYHHPEVQQLVAEARALSLRHDTSPVVKIQAMQRYIRQRMRADEGAWRTFEAAQQREGKVAVSLGDYLQARLGVCKQNALALQLSLQEMGIESRYVRGFVELPDGRLGGHAWVEAKLEGRWYLLDNLWDEWNLKPADEVYAPNWEGGRGYRPVKRQGQEAVAYKPSTPRARPQVAAAERYPVGKQVWVPRTSGQPSPGVVEAHLPNGKVRVTFAEGYKDVARETLDPLNPVVVQGPDPGDLPPEIARQMR